jgi:hypothetical protein
MNHPAAESTVEERRARAKKAPKKKDDDDNDPRPTAGAIVARFFPFFRPVRPLALA